MDKTLQAVEELKSRILVFGGLITSWHASHLKVLDNSDNCKTLFSKCPQV